MNQRSLIIIFLLLELNNLTGQGHSTLLLKSIEFQLKELAAIDSTYDQKMIDSMYLDAARSECPGDLLIEIIEKENKWLHTYLIINKNLQEEYSRQYNIAKDSFKNSTSEFNVLVDKLFIIDQTARIKYRKIIKDFFPKVSITLQVIDTCNYVLLAEKFYVDPLLLVESNLGFERSRNLFILLLHEARDLSQEEFHKLDSLLLDLIKKKLFSPAYYAMIYDDRLLKRDDPSYPVFNQLRGIKIEDRDKFNEINRRRIKIGLDPLK
jgi:hypothetical protein